MAHQQRQTKNSSKSYTRPSFGGSTVSGPSSSTTPKRAPESVAQQYFELNEKIGRLIESNSNLESKIGSLLEKVSALESQNKTLAADNEALLSDNINLGAKLSATETKLSAIYNEIDFIKQSSLRKTVELLEVPVEAGTNPVEFLHRYSLAVGSEVKDSDINNIFVRTHKTKKNLTKTKIIVEFVSLKTRMNFYFAGRDNRFEKPQQRNSHQQPERHTRGAEYRFVKVVDALTQQRKSIFFDIIEKRKEHKDVVKNVWISNGDVFIRRFGSTAAEPVKDQNFVDLLFQTNQ